MLVIGIAAALSIPPLAMNFKRAGYASSLSAAVSTFENAMNTIIIKDGANDLYGTRTWRNLSNSSLKRREIGLEVNSVTNEIVDRILDKSDENFVSSLSDTLDLEVLDQFFKIYTNVTSLADGAPKTPKDYVVFRAKGGYTFCIVPHNQPDPSARGENAVLLAGGHLYESVATVYIDANGVNPPNIFGRDLFVFELGSDGVLYPYGSLDVSVYTSLNDNNIWNKDGSSWACTDGKITGDAWGCTARLIENNYRMDY